MYKNEQTRKNYRETRNDSKLATVKVTGLTTDIVAEIQDIIAEAYGDRIILSPILRSHPQGFHAFCTILEEK